VALSDDPYGLKLRRMILNQHHQRFKKLQRESKWAEALQQFNVTLNYAMESANYSMQVLEKVKERMQKERMSRAAQTSLANAFYDYRFKK